MAEDKKDGFEVDSLDGIYAEHNDRERAELELVEKGARLITGLNDGSIAKHDFMDEADSMMEHYIKKLKLASLDIDEILSLLRKVFVRASKIKRVTKIKRKKKISPDGSV